MPQRSKDSNRPPRRIPKKRLKRRQRRKSQQKKHKNLRYQLKKLQSLMMDHRQRRK
jgi:hypothetical protein